MPNELQPASKKIFTVVSPRLIKDGEKTFTYLHFYPEMISTGLHMTELAGGINNNFSDFKIDVLCSYPSKNIFTEAVAKADFRNVKIIRKKSGGREHGAVLHRLVFSGSFFIRVLSYLIFIKRICGIYYYYQSTVFRDCHCAAQKNFQQALLFDCV